MNFLLGMLGTFFGIILAIIFIFLLIYLKLRKSFGAARAKELLSAIKNHSTVRKQEYSTPKTVAGMTNIAEPLILSDIPDFNKNLLYNMVEKNLTKIFDCEEKKTIAGIKGDKDLILIEPKVEDKIREMREKKIQKNYSDITFNKHAIKEYIRAQGMATVVTTSSVGYKYTSNIPEEAEFNGIKKQTIYTCEFVYIFDEQRIGEFKNTFSVKCPHCGGTLNTIGPCVCSYCRSYVTPINLKNWKMSSYKEEIHI